MRITLFLFFTFTLSFTFTNSLSQVTPPANDNAQQKTEEKIEKLATEGDENVDYEELQQTLDDFRQHPLNLNTATSAQLHLLGLLNENQILNLQQHIQQNGKLISLEELQTIEGFDGVTIELILPYVTVNATSDKLHLSFKQLIAAGTNQVLIRTGRVLNTQYGYTIEDTSVTHYLGSPWALYVRYKFSYSRKYSFGITAEKDAGEQFFKGTQPNGFDYYSVHLFVRDIGIFKKIAVGDYQLEYGQGLNIWSGLAFGKSPDISTTKRNARGINPYTSVNEESFRRGAAISIGMKNFQLDLYYSKRKVDGNILPQDSLGAEFIVSSLQTSGLHRTQAEVDDKNSIGIQSYGGHFQYDIKNFQVGLTISKVILNQPLDRNTELYSQFQFYGDQFLKTSLDFQYSVRNITLYGEAAHSDNGANAVIVGAIMALDPKFALSLLYRNYDRDYQAIESNALRESNNFNEKGYLIGYNFKPIKQISFNGYFDLFTFPWLRYQVNAPSHGFDYIAQLTYTPNKKLEIYFRYKQQIKQTNTNELNLTTDYLSDENQTGTRFSLSYKLSDNFSIRSRIDFVKVKQEQYQSNGFALSQDLFFKSLGSPFSCNVRLVLFDTDDYNSRIYAYENDVYGVFSIPSYYYQGMRYYLNVRYKLFKGFDVFVRIAQTIYTNQKTISSGLDEINGNKKADLRIAVKWEF